jgi:uncharacterized membrane protein (UPF0127 family)
MRTGSLFDIKRQLVIGRSISYAGSFLTRLVGLLGKENIPSDEGMWFPNTSSIHTFGMSSYIDVMFLNPDDKIVAIHPNVRPWKILFGPSGTSTVLELGPHSSANVLAIGDQLRFDE